MSPENFDTALLEFKELEPFHVFTIELKTKERLEVDHRDAIIGKNGLAVFLSPGGQMRLIDHDRVVQIIAAPKHQIADS